MSRITRLRQGKHSRYIHGFATSEFVSPSASLSTITPSRFAIELRDSDFNLKGRLEHVVVALQWEWNRIGGCGRCSMTLEGDYLGFNIAADDDIRIYLPNASSGATLVYRGYVETVTPGLSGGYDGNIKVECGGYFGWLDRIVVHDSGDIKTYTNSEVSLIVEAIVDNFITSVAPITKGTIDRSTFVPDELEFKDTAKNSLRTLFDLLGNIEYGVNASLEFYWRTQSEDVSDKIYLGGNVVKLSDRVDFKGIVNKIYFEGGDVDGVVFTPTPTTAQDSIDRYGLHEEVISNGSIVTNAVASQYMSSIFLQRAKPPRQLNISLKNTAKRFESMQPMGAIAVVDPDIAQARYIWGTTANGGSNKLWGRLANGGDNIIYGAVRKEQIDRVLYTLSPEDGRVDAEVQFGSSIGYSKSSATLRRIELVQSALRQRSL